MLEAHQICLKENFFFKLSSISLLFFSLCVNFKLPIYLIFLAPSIFRYFTESLFEERQRSNLLNKLFALEVNFFHFLKDFFVILAFKSSNGIPSFLIFVIMFGQISESMNIAIDGFQ